MLLELSFKGVISNTSEMRDDALKNNTTWYIHRLVTIDTDFAVMSFDNIKQVNHLKCQLLVVTGEKDRKVHTL
jgi:glycerol-3-phosphate responsive antiterminator